MLLSLEGLSLKDFDKNIIDAKIDTKIKNNSFFVLVKGDMNKPTISLDVKNFLKNKIDKKIEDNKDKIEEKLNKVLKDKDSEKTKELIKNIKSLF